MTKRDLACERVLASYDWSVYKTEDFHSEGTPLTVAQMRRFLENGPATRGERGYFGVEFAICKNRWACFPAAVPVTEAMIRLLPSRDEHVRVMCLDLLYEVMVSTDPSKDGLDYHKRCMEIVRGRFWYLIELVEETKNEYEVKCLSDLLHLLVLSYPELRKPSLS